MSEIEQTTQEVAEAPRSARKKKAAPNRLMMVGGLVVGLGVAFGGAYALGIFPSKSETGGETAVVAPVGDIVATVNNVTITRDELNKKVEEIKMSYGGTADPSQDAAFELQVLDEVINLRLLVNEAESQSITVSEDEINAELAALTESMGGEEGLQAQLDAVSLSREQLLENMRNEMMLKKLLEANTTIKDIVVSDEEVKAMYDDAIANAPEGQDIPPFEEVAEIARTQLTQQKSGEIIQAYIAELREKATIDIAI
jgi:FKBP-type peptidyl-prolyl cis-trans isomerase (trigger factor)